MPKRTAIFKPKRVGRAAAALPAAAPYAKASPSKRGYGRQWQKLRAIHLAGNPLCVFCLKRGRPTVATVVDHKNAHKGNRVLLLDPDNLQSLCKPCHDRDKQRMERGSKAIRWGVDGLPLPAVDDDEGQP